MQSAQKKNRRVKLVNYDRLFETSPHSRFLNDIYFQDPTVNILDLIFQKQEGNIEFTPRCECGEYQGEIYKGHVCPFCQTVVQSDFTSNFKPTNWVRIPDSFPKVIHPRFYILLTRLGGRNRDRIKGNKLVKRSKVPIIDYILNVEEVLPPDIAEGVTEQGFGAFYRNHEEILRFLLLEHPKLSKLDAAKAIWRIYENEDTENLFTDKLPLLNPIFHPMMVRGKFKTIDKITDFIMPPVINLIHSTYATEKLVTPHRNGEKSLWKVFSQYIKYIQKIMELKIGDKYALVRRHCVAARMHFTSRAVISPITDRHKGDEVHLPWNIAAVMFQPELLNLLMNRHGYTPTSAIEYFYQHVNKYSSLMDDCFKTLIAECPADGIPILINRNPTLIPESIRLLRVTKINPNPEVKVIRLSPRICKGFNADHDGDELNTYPVKETGMLESASRMHPMEGILSKTSLTVSGWAKPTTEAFIHLNEFLHYERDNTNECNMTLPPPEIVRLEAKKILTK